jgi:hypothetical protein
MVDDETEVVDDDASLAGMQAEMKQMMRGRRRKKSAAAVVHLG